MSFKKFLNRNTILSMCGCKHTLNDEKNYVIESMIEKLNDCIRFIGYIILDDANEQKRFLQIIKRLKRQKRADYFKISKTDYYYVIFNYCDPFDSRLDRINFAEVLNEIHNINSF